MKRLFEIDQKCIDRTKIISLILRESELFTPAELKNYSNEQLNSIIKSLFLNIRVKQAENRAIKNKLSLHTLKIKRYLNLYF